MVKLFRQIAKRTLSLKSHRIYELPILLLMPHSRCNCRCIMCDIWKANQNKQELKAEDFSAHLAGLKKLNVQQIALSGGEALMHSNLWAFCEALRPLNVKITLLSSGLLLKAHAKEIINHCAEVIVSLDGGEMVHNQIRNIPRAFQKLQEGVAALKKIKADFPVNGRCVLQRLNFRDFPNIIEAAIAIGLDQISFLAADVSSLAFNRPKPLPDERVAEIALTPNEIKEFREIVDRAIEQYQSAFAAGFVAETPAKIRKIIQYYEALCGLRPSPPVRCNAPWVSAVVESNGDLRPCFFHRKLGNIYEDDLMQIINSPKSVQFRKNLDVATNPVCQKCVCSLYLKPSTQIR